MSQDRSVRSNTALKSNEFFNRGEITVLAKVDMLLSRISDRYVERR